MAALQWSLMHSTDDVINMDGTDQEFKFVRECITGQCNLNGNKMHWEITLPPPSPLQVKDFLLQICSDKMSENVTPDLYHMAPHEFYTYTVLGKMKTDLPVA